MSGEDEREKAIDELDEVVLAIKGTARLAMEGEQSDDAARVVTEIGAILGLIAVALDGIVRLLDPSRDQDGGQ